MDFQLVYSQIFIQLLLGLVSVIFAELVRDVYHLAGHYWKPLQSYHTLHHKAYRRDLSMTSLEMYKKAQWYNDVPEALVMVGSTALVAGLAQNYGMWLGCLYSLMFLIPAIARSQGLLLQTDLTHKPGDLVEIPSRWTVNRTYHWRHHFDQGNAYFCGYFTVVDKVLGTSLSLKGKVVAITGASGTLGQALMEELSLQGAKIVALTTSKDAQFKPGIEVLQWQLGAEADLMTRLKSVDILIVNHGVNVYGDRSPEAIQKSYEINTFSALKLAELFLSTVTESDHKAIKELWINTSEAEVNPALSPLYELSKRTLGDLITLRRLDAPCIIRKLILGPFKSQLNPYGVMSARWVSWAIVALAKRDFRNIIVTINPISYIAFPIKEFFQSLYFRLFTSAHTQVK
ncbi:bifunctional sterol desaturase/short chain dehydrogenase [Planktothrix sp. FACHB-1355]|uniref:Bifunctional sterol desaturase/short chain dehydrogenase n=1 Tax=Aerosakkonema funiforme FACHB-1375 TaxID=2949571 RepID=A0A926VIQ4_9CYAN|nr:MULTISPECIES: bifunctional sterol desaturase/short chain dehydrogenase [Oscillatoriales]MBD2183224.1 bifunctional sterol desaturase/short chain dehydrogenase [Aerosakkonema funiforme FACHB-1375]MBD3561267.1 bifunctional sterol desaturase/short chain dehydrogenase [Planktothrix sp. FACHB-1355]